MNSWWISRNVGSSKGSGIAAHCRCHTKPSSENKNSFRMLPVCMLRIWQTKAMNRFLTVLCNTENECIALWQGTHQRLLPHCNDVFAVHCFCIPQLEPVADSPQRYIACWYHNADLPSCREILWQIDTLEVKPCETNKFAILSAVSW